jgi:hypothetical protein
MLLLHRYGALMLEGASTLMWTGQKDVLVRDLLCSAASGRALLVLLLS